MEIPGVAKVEIRNDVTADNQKGPIYVIRNSPDRSGCTKATRGILMIGYLRTKISTVPEVSFDGFWEEIGQHQYPIKTVPDEQPDDMFEHGAACHRHHGFWAFDRKGSEPGPVSASHDHGFQ
jgi:hypothetical protein